MMAGASVRMPSAQALSEKIAFEKDVQCAAMMAGYVLAAQAVTAMMSKTLPEQHATLSHMQRSEEPEILVVDGASDTMQFLLQASQIPYAKLDRDQTKFIGSDLERFRSINKLFINSGVVIPRDKIDSVFSFVYGGGLLMTSRSGLGNIVSRIFPNVVDDKSFGLVSGHGKSVGVMIANGERDDPSHSAGQASYRSMLSKIYEVAGRCHLELSWPASRAVLNFQLKQKTEIILEHDEKTSDGNPLFLRVGLGRGSLYHMSTGVFLKGSPLIRGAGATMTAGGFAATLGLPNQIVDRYTNSESFFPNFNASVAANTMLSLAAFMMPVLAKAPSRL